MRHKKLITGGAILCVAIVALIAVAVGSSMPYYESISKFRDQGDSIYDKTVKVHGHLLEAREEGTEGGVLTHTFDM